MVFKKFISNKNDKKIEVVINTPVYLGLSTLHISRIAMLKFWYDYIKPKYRENTKLCCMDTNSFIVYIKNRRCFCRHHKRR